MAVWTATGCAPRAPKPTAAGTPATPEVRVLYARFNDLITAVVMRDRAAATELLSDGKNPNSRQSDGQTALMVAAIYGDLEMAQLLLAKGADPNFLAPGGTTALSQAREGRHAAMVSLLESRGAKR